VRVTRLTALEVEVTVVRVICREAKREVKSPLPGISLRGSFVHFTESRSAQSVASGPRGGFRVSGWVDRKKSAFNPEAIALVSEMGKVVGLGVMSLSINPFVLKVRRRIPTWTGYVADRFQARRVNTYVLSTDGRPMACQLTGEVQEPALTAR
jgi:hypothetical protein